MRADSAKWNVRSSPAVSPVKMRRVDRRDRDRDDRDDRGQRAVRDEPVAGAIPEVGRLRMRHRLGLDRGRVGS